VVVDAARACGCLVRGFETLEKKALTVLLVEDSPDYAELVQDWLAVNREDMSFVLNWTETP